MGITRWSCLGSAVLKGDGILVVVGVFILVREKRLIWRTRRCVGGEDSEVQNNKKKDDEKLSWGEGGGCSLVKLGSILNRAGASATTRGEGR